MISMIQPPSVSKSVAGHQPNFIPWFGYFEKMFRADIFVFSDDVRFPKQSYVNRVAIPVDNGNAEFQWALPVLKGNDETIAGKLFMKDEKTLKKMLRTIEINLGGLPHFADIGPILEEFSRAYHAEETVASLNIRINRHIAGLLGIATPTFTGTELGLGAYRRNERLIARCRILGCDTYLSGQGADGYTEPAKFDEAGLKLVYLDYSLGKRLLGDKLKYSILVAIGLLGVRTLREALEQEGALEKGTAR